MKGTDMAQPSYQGLFIWHELLCHDTSAASAFYERILPWKGQPFSPGSPYLMFRGTDGQPVAGAMRLSDDARAIGTGPHWRGYIGASDVDATCGQAVALGGRIQQPAQDVPGVGRIAMLTDPEGATFGLFCPLTDSYSGPSRSAFAWNELAVRNREAALAFYQRLFGWQLRAPMDMGGGFYYQTFGIGQQDFGGAYSIPADRAMPPAWCPYAVSGNADETGARVIAAGGQVAHGPVDVPGGGRIVQFFDAQRAFFAVHSMPVAGAGTGQRKKPRATASAPKAVAKKKAKKPAKKTARKTPRKTRATPKRRAAAKRAARPAAKSARRQIKRRVRRVKRRVERRVRRAKRKVVRLIRRAKRKAARKK
jgi:predicted enzyme related to lactoylglutathione lyase